MSPPSFLDFPFEIRLIIYRLLLRKDDLIGGDGTKLHPSIIRTCRQVLSEAHCVLYGENTHLIKINNSSGPDYTSITANDYLADWNNDLAIDRIQHLRRFKITIQYSDEYELDLIRQAIRKVCSGLSTIPRLDYVCIAYEYWPCFVLGLPSKVEEKLGYMVQTYFGQLRDVGVVVVQDVLPRCADVVTRRMMGSEPEDPLLKMYEELEKYAAPIQFCDGDLRRACWAMEEGDGDSFQYWRDLIVRRITGHVENMTRELYRHDPGGKADDKEAIE